MPRSLLKTRQAFTLIELLVVIAIMGVLLSLGIVSLRGISGSSNLTTSGFQVAELLDSAREQSILARAPVAVAMLLNNSDQARRAFAAFQYVPAASGPSGTWKQVARWESLPDGVITDSTNSGTVDATQAFVGSTSPSMGTGNALPTVTYHGTSLAPKSGYAYVVFLPDGSLYQASKSYQLTLVPGLSDNNGTVQHVGTGNNCQVVINNATGRVRVIRP